MKKQIITLFLVAIFFMVTFLASKVYAFKNSEWKRLTKNICINTKTNKLQDNIKVAWFKIYHSEEKYELIEIKAYCDTKVLEIKHTKLYDKNHNLLKDEINNYGVGCDYTGLVNGEIYFHILCIN